MEHPLTDKIKSPDDLKSMSMEELTRLASEIRDEIITTVSQNGGHLAPNLGIVELTIALHRVFHAPEDKIVWDVGHQSYPHKILTGRADAFSSIRKYDGLCGFTKRGESPYDCFGGGHAGVSISAAMGFSAAAEIQKKHEHAVAVLGDGALICGISLEAMNNLRSSCENMIIVLNDNKMSIARSIGAIPNYLNSLITGKNYNRFKAFAKMMVQKIPGGENLVGNIQQLESSAKSLFVPGIFFEEMGIRYIGPINGHQLPELIETLERVKEFHRPVLVHVITEKGHGCEYAIQSPEEFHGIGSFNPLTGKTISSGPARETFSQAFGKKLFEMTEKHPDIVAVTAAMASGCGISHEYIQKFRNRFFDVGIAEEHAAVFASGLAAGGMRPVVAIYATFLQRAMDCIFHDICLQNLPVIFCADRAGIVEDGPTHHGIYDVAFFRAMPNLILLEPRNERELEMMMEEAYRLKCPVVIRYAKGSSGMDESEKPPEPVVPGKAEILTEGSDLIFWACGREVYQALHTAHLLQEKWNISAGVVNARSLKPFDCQLLRAQAEKCPIVTLEDHVKTGGLASAAAETLVHTHHRGLISFGWEPDRIIPHGAVNLLRRDAGLLPEQIAESILREFFPEHI